MAKGDPIPSHIAYQAPAEMSDPLDYFESRLSIDFFHLIAGKKLGYGISRTVYECKINPKWVLKFELNSKTFQNVMEWEMWTANQHGSNGVAQWLAPCHHISECGTILVQARTTAITEELYPARIPTWVTDAARKNWGVLEGKPVLHDYGYTFALSGLGKRLKKNSYHGVKDEWS